MTESRDIKSNYRYWSMQFSQDIKDKMDYMFERREMTPFKEDGSGEDFQEDPSRGKENQKTPPEVKQGAKDSNVYKSNGE